MINRFPGKCFNCGDYVPAGAGDLSRAADGKWQTHCAPECYGDDDDRAADAYDRWVADAPVRAAREAAEAANRAAILADYAADPTATRQRLWDALQRTIRQLPQTMDYSDVPAQAAYHDAKWAWDQLPEIGTLDWANAQRIGDADSSSGYYTITKERVPVVDGPIFIPALSEPLYKAAGFHGAYYGSAGGYSTQRILADNGDGTVTVEDCYHHGD